VPGRPKVDAERREIHRKIVKITLRSDAQNIEA
jgi:hypothetical protein